jgi:prepilin-type N-terminal cleavage/methylation domain-containing protein
MKLRMSFPSQGYSRRSTELGDCTESGFSLMELLITLSIFTIVTAMIYSVSNQFLKNASSQRKAVKTELDVVAVAWPLIKEIQSAGFGVPSSGACTPSINFDSTAGELTVHSTSAGDDRYAGSWSYVTGASCVTSGIPGSKPVVVISSLDRKYLASATINTDGNALSSCSGDYAGAIAYWSPSQSAGDLDCYEARYKLGAYSSDKPAMCAQGSKKLWRSISRTTTDTSYQPVLDCALDLEFRFGCIDATGALTWQTGSNCGTAKLRLLKMGLIVQNSTRKDSQAATTSITLFDDLDTSLRSTVTLTNELRYYSWKKREHTIALRNLE